jgi:ATP-binding protein involved in chromosome partitioning
MNANLETAVLDALKRIAAPDGRGNLVSSGRVSGIAINEGEVMFAIDAGSADPSSLEPLRRAAERAVAAVPGVVKVMAALTAERAPGPKAREAAPLRNGVPGVKHIIAVASGKGGVGKSTVSINLALALSQLGLSVAILDADIYGPSLPKLLGLSGARPQLAGGQGKIMLPLERYGLKAMSIGFLVDESTAMIWRGPMVMSALVQMLRDVAWQDIDVMVVDMPPGTGDAQLTLAQQTPLSGAVVVSTPQDLALIDARKALTMFSKVNVPVIGIVENMSYFVCPDCGGRHEIFGHGGARAEAARLNVPFLGEVPLDAKLRERSDNGEPVVATDPASPLTAIFLEMARQVSASLSTGGLVRKPPRIIMES